MNVPWNAARPRTSGGGCRGLLWAGLGVCSVGRLTLLAAVGAGGGARVRHGHDGQSVAPGDRLGEAYLDAGRLEDARTCALQV